MKLSDEQKRKAITDLLADGLYYMGNYGLDMVYDDKHYKMCKSALELRKEQFIAANPDATADYICRENVWAEMILTGCAIKFDDSEGDNDGYLSLNNFNTRYDESLPFALGVLKVLNEDNDVDADVSDMLLQLWMYNEVIFG